MPNFVVTPAMQAKYRFRFFGITLLLATPSEFSQNTAGGSASDIKQFLDKAGINDDADQKICTSFIQAFRNDHTVNQAALQLQSALHQNFGAGQAVAVYPQTACPLYADCVDIMSNMNALDDRH
jgi:hypothetical protein